MLSSNTHTLRFFTLPGPERRRLCRWVREDGTAIGPFFHLIDLEKAREWLRAQGREEKGGAR